MTFKEYVLMFLPPRRWGRIDVKGPRLDVGTAQAHEENDDKDRGTSKELGVRMLHSQLCGRISLAGQAE